MRRHTVTTCFGLVLLLFLNGCATTPPYNPFSVAKADIYETVDVIGLVPFRSQIKAYDLDTKLAAMEEQAISKLETAGFQVIPSIEYKKIYDEAKEAIGPMYDPDTGELDKDKKKILDEQTLGKYLSQHSEVDALMYGGINIVKANWHSNNASWDGASESTSGKDGFWANFGLGKFSGTIPALSFSTYIERTDKTRLYSLYGGVQLVQWFQGRKFVDIPKHLILSDKTKINEGIARSLNALISKGAYVAKEIYTVPIVAATSNIDQFEQPASTLIVQPTSSTEMVPISGTYISEITSNRTQVFKKKYQNLKITIKQTGNNIIATDNIYNLKISGVREGNVIKFSVRPNQVVSRFWDASGEWTVSPNGTSLEGLWKLDGGSGARGKWNLTKIE